MKKPVALLCLSAALALFAFAACDGDDNGPGDVSTDDAAPDTPADDGGSAPDGYPAGMETLACSGADCQWTGCPDLPPVGDNVTVRLVCEDFEQGFSVENAYIDVFLGNSVTDTPDFELGPTDSEGRTDELQAPANSLFTYRVNASTEIVFPPGEIKTSIEYGQAVPSEGGDIDVLAVSRHTYQLISTVLGIPPSPGLGILAGALEDCGGAEVEGAVARLYAGASSEPCKDEDENVCLDRYFVDETPARDQKWSSEDGLYGILEIPPGDNYTLELHGKMAGSSCPGQMEIVGELAGIRILPDAISIVDVSSAVAGEHMCVW